MSFAKQEIKHWGNRYTFLKKIGTGAHGTAYKVKDINGPEGQGSIKVLKEICVDGMSKDEIDDCSREGKLLSKLINPHIVQYFDSFCFLGNYCIITEYCEGGDLNKVLVDTKQKGCHLNEKRILRWFIEIIQGLDYIHKRRILHRDLKPRNIFLKSDSAKIGDFGISRILNFTMDMASTFLGTPYYMSPEVLKHDGYNTTSDIWSIGVILYEMCSLQHAFEGQSIMSVMVKILEESVPKIPSMYNEDIQNIIEFILIKDPSKRPSAHDVLELQFIKKTIKDPWIDIAEDLDLSSTFVERETKIISEYMSKSIDLNPLDTNSNNETVTLTPKQLMDLNKRLKADEEAERIKQINRETYQENQELKNIVKQKSFIDSLPFSKTRYDKIRTSISECDEFNSFHHSKAQTTKSKSNVLKESFESLSRTENIRNHFNIESKPSIFSGDKHYDIPIHEDKTIRSSNNHQELYNIKYSDLKYDDLANCKTTTYKEDDDPGIIPGVELIYESDFDSEGSISNSDNEKDPDGMLHQAIVDKFQDDDATDPYGKSKKKKKICTMINKCLEKIDEATLEKALKYLETHYTRNYISGLRKICDSDDVAMIVDQIFFLINPNREIY